MASIGIHTLGIGIFERNEAYKIDLDKAVNIILNLTAAGYPTSELEITVMNDKYFIRKKVMVTNEPHN